MRVKSLRSWIGILKALGFGFVIGAIVVILTNEPSYLSLSIFLLLLVISLVFMLIREHLINKVLGADLGKDRNWQNVLRSYESRGIRRL